MNLLQLAKIERDRLNRVIALLEDTTRTSTASASKPKKQGRKWTQAEKDAMSRRIKALNAAKKKAPK